MFDPVGAVLPPGRIPNLHVNTKPQRSVVFGA